MNQVRCNWCVPIVLLSIWYNVCTYHSPVGHYIVKKTAVVVACVIFIPGFSPCGGYWVGVFCLHQVSYLRLRDELGVCLSYYCLSGTTCVLVVVQYTGVYLVHRVYLSYSTISLHCCYFFVLGILYHSCVCRGSVIIEFVSRMNSQRGCWVCWKSKKTYFYEILAPGIISV